MSGDLVASAVLLLWCGYRAWRWWRVRGGLTPTAQDARRILWLVGPLVLLMGYWWTRL